MQVIQWFLERTCVYVGELWISILWTKCKWGSHKQRHSEWLSDDISWSDALSQRRLKPWVFPHIIRALLWPGNCHWGLLALSIPIAMAHERSRHVLTSEPALSTAATDHTAVCFFHTKIPRVKYHTEWNDPCVMLLSTSLENTVGFLDSTTKRL